jgi:hypothetical protein
MIRPLAALALLAAPATAQTMAPGECFLRQYSRDHMASHTDQTVTLIALGPETGAEEADAPILRLMVMVRGDSEAYRGSAYCDGWGVPMDCLMEGDAGAFRIEPAKGGVRLTLAVRGVSFEGTRDFVTLDGDRGDDRVFLLPRVPADACP